jgi:hypothetical protein
VFSIVTSLNIMLLKAWIPAYLASYEVFLRSGIRFIRKTSWVTQKFLSPYRKPWFYRAMFSNTTAEWEQSPPLVTVTPEDHTHGPRTGHKHLLYPHQDCCAMVQEYAQKLGELFSRYLNGLFLSFFVPYMLYVGFG